MANAIRILNKTTVEAKIRREIEAATGVFSKENIVGKARKAFKPTAEDMSFLCDSFVDSGTDSVMAEARSRHLSADDIKDLIDRAVEEMRRPKKSAEPD